ncbi:MAG: NADH-quinone oxidoreductase subunit J [Candidatus Bathyarchaeota archaeon]|nr:NADH-quinone oxidoreductase subunit J [Candidatus Bathyarchaeota archaeon]
MILEVVSAGLIITACLAIFLDEAVYSVAALAGTFLLTSLLYALNGAIFVAIFQFAIGIDTVAILFLAGETLSERPETKTKPSMLIGVAVLGVILSLPMIFFSISSPSTVTSTVSFGEALWNYNAVDVILQGLVIVTLAVGIPIVLFQRKKRHNQKRSAAQ